MIKVILPAFSIPEGRKVTKITGSTFYTLLKEIKVYGEKKEDLQVLSSPDVRYLVGENGSINAISAGKELMWRASADDLMRYLRSRDDLDDDEGEDWD